MLLSCRILSGNNSSSRRITSVTVVNISFGHEIYFLLPVAGIKHAIFEMRFHVKTHQKIISASVMRLKVTPVSKTIRHYIIGRDIIFAGRVLGRHSL